jgi:hypothetical protein
VLRRLEKPHVARELLQPVLSRLDSGSEPELLKNEALARIVSELFPDKK